MFGGLAAVIIFVLIYTRRMSHEHLRKETDCLNCGTTVTGPYCQQCGQKNLVPKQSLWHLITHFFNDITHFDGRFFKTLKLLLARPGFVSAEWVRGRRTAYLDPVRMYLFVSALSVLVIFSVIDPPDYKYVSQSSEQARMLQTIRDTAENEFGFYVQQLPDTLGKVFVLTLEDEYQHGLAYYDSLQRSLPVSKRASGLDRYLDRGAVQAYQVYNHDPFNFLPTLVRKWLGAVSKVFFISLPVFACLLALLYVRRRKKFYFVSHAIFSLHFYIVCLLWLAITLPVFVWLSGKSEGAGTIQTIENLLSLVIPLFMFIYLFIAMKRFYEQGWIKTFFKAVILYFSNGLVLVFLILMFLINSFVNMGS